MKYKRFTVLLVYLAMLFSMLTGPLPAVDPVMAQSAGEPRADAVVLVNSSSASYTDFEHYIQPYLDHFGIPYTVLDIAAVEVAADIGDYAVIITGHRQLDSADAYLSAAEEGYIADAVNAGTGLVNFDNDLASAGSGYYAYVQSVFGFSYAGAAGSGSLVTFPSGVTHYITERHSPGSSKGMFSTMTLSPITGSLPAGVTAIALSGTAPFLAVTTYGTGRAVQWGSYDWMSNTVLGPVYGMDDLVWRSIAWAARKPFVMQGMPPFVTMRVDDESGNFEWIHIANEYGYKPWAGLFIDNIDSIEAADLSALVHAGLATATIHAYGGSFFYIDHSTGNLPDATVTANFANGTAWHTTHNVPIGKWVLPHYYEMGSNVFEELGAWDVRLVGTMQDPGTLYGAPWIMNGPFRKFETGGSSAGRPVYYAGYMAIPGHPELDHQFFNVVTEIRDDNGYEWYPNLNDVADTIGHGTRQLVRALDGMQLATLFTHGYYVGGSWGSTAPANWAAILEGINENIASYNPVFVTMDYAAQYIRATYDSNITSATYDPDSKLLTTNFGAYDGAAGADMATKFYVFMEGDGSIMVDVPAFTGTTSVAYTLPGPLDHITVSPENPSVPVADTQQFTATGYDADNNPIPNMPFTWSVTNGGGTVNASGLFTAGTTLGTFANTVTATSGGVSGSASVTVVAPVVDHFEFAAIASPKYAGAPFSVTIRARDDTGDLVPGFTGTATLSASAGTLSPTETGSFTAGAWTGQVSIAEVLTGVTLTAASGSATGTSNSFDLSATPTCPCSIWDISAVPATPHNADPQSVEVGVKFRAGTDGYITALRVYRGAGNLAATYSGHLWSSTGALLATTTIPAVSAAGWQQAVLSEPVFISADTTYVASFFTTTGYPVTRSYFTTANRALYERPPLRALVDGEENGNGVYNYGPSAVFPTLSYESSNYYIDVVFETAPESDTTPPAVSATAPAPYAVGVSVSSDITAAFTEAVTPETVSAATFELRDAGNNLVPAVVTYDPATFTARLNPDAALAYNTTYTATLATGITDLAGNPLSSAYTWSFTTERQLDHFTFAAISSPQVSGTSFNVTITAQDPTNNPVPTFTGTVTLSASGGATISPTTSAAFTSGSWTGLVTVSSATALTGVTITAASGSITGTSNAFDLSAASGCPCSIWTDATTPAEINLADHGSVELGVKFRSNEAGYITGLRVYRATTTTGAFDAHLWSAGGTLLASVPFPAPTTTGWQQAVLSAPVAITADTTYVASYHTATGYARTGAYFIAANRTAFERPPLRALVSDESGGNGVYTYSTTTAFPTSTYNYTNYFVDVVFNTELPVDTTPPVVQSTLPAANAVGVSASADITATFNEALDPGTVSAATFELRDASNQLVPAVVSYESGTYTARLNPNAALVSGATYTATLMSGITDLAGNPLNQVTWSFTISQVLDRFAFDVISSPQALGMPFSVTVRAVDPVGALFSTYTGTAALSASGGAEITNTQTGAFTAGVWTGYVYLSAAGPLTGVTITAADGAASGQSAAFDLVQSLPAPEFYTVTSPAYTYNEGESFAVNVAAYQGLTINGWEDAHQFPVLATTTSPTTLTPPIPNDGQWTEFSYISRPFPGIFAGVDEEDYGLPTMRFYASGIPSGTYTVIANLYDNAAMRYYYGFTAADPKALYIDVPGGAPTTQFREYSLGSVTVTDGNFNLYFRDGDYLSGQDYRVFGWSWVRLVPVGNVATGSVTLSSSLASVQFDGNGNGVFGEAGDATKALAGGALSINARATTPGSDVTITASDAEGRSGQHLFTILNVNDAPVAVGESYTTYTGVPLTVAAPGVLGNDSDEENDGLTAALASGPAHGSLTLNADGSFTYTSAPGYTGADSFTYVANDGQASSAQATVAITVIPEGIFADGFESGDLSRWSSRATGGGDLSVTAEAALIGNYGMQAVINDNTSIYLNDDSPNGEKRYRARFYFDPNSISMASGDSHFLMMAYPTGAGFVLNVTFRYLAGTGYQLQMSTQTDTSSYLYTSYYTISDAAHFIEFDWQAASAPGANDGHLTFWIDGVQQASLTGIDNDTRQVDGARLGATWGVDTGTRGTYYFDAFASGRAEYKGVDGIQAGFTASPTHGNAPLTISFTDQSQSSEPITSYLWDFGDGVGTSTEANPTYTYTGYGSYTVTLTVSSAAGTDSETVANYIQVLEAIFADGFESGDLSAWSSSGTDGGDLNVAAEAALVGGYGMQAVIDDNTSIYVIDESPIAEKRYRARFHFDPNSISMASGDSHFLMMAYPTGAGFVLNVTFRYLAGTGYQLQMSTQTDTSSYLYTSYYTISDAAHFIEFDWQAASAPGANDGHLTFWIDGVQQANLTGIDNDTRQVDGARLGATWGVDTGTRGTYYFDAFASGRAEYKGVDGIQAGFTASPTQGNAPLTVSFTDQSQSSEPITSYLWDFGDGVGTSTEANPIYTYTGYGSYTVTLTVSGPAGTDSETVANYIQVKEAIFSDGFESENLGAWTSSVTDGGDLSVTAGAALVGGYGMQAVIDDNTSIYVIDESPIAEKRYRARFHFDPNSISMASGDSHFLMMAYPTGAGFVLNVNFRYLAGTGYQLQMSTQTDTGSYLYTSYYTISDAAHFIEFDWQAASAPGANDGHLTFWIDGVQQASLTGIDNDTRQVDGARLGATWGVDTGTRGTYYFDAFVSGREAFIGE